MLASTSLKFLKYLKKGNKNNLLQNINWLFFEKIIRAIAGLYISAVVVRYLGAENFGILSYSLALVATFSSISDFGIESIVIQDLVLRKNKDKILTTAFIFKLLTGLFGAGLAILSAILLSSKTNLIVTITAIASVSLILNSVSVVDFWFQSIVKSKISVIARTIPFIIIIPAKLIGVEYDLGLIFFAGVYSLEYLLVLFLFLLFFLKKNNITLKFSKKYALKIFNRGLPLLISSVSVLLIMNTDKIMLGKLNTNYEVGIYSIAANISNMLYFIPVIIGGTFMPSMLKNWRDSEIINFNNTLKNLFGYTTTIGFIILLCCFFFGKLFITILYGIEFLESFQILNLHLLTFIFVSHVSIRNRSFIIQDKIFFVSLFSTLTLIMNITLNFLFIPNYGSSGAVISSLTSWIFCALVFPLFSDKTNEYPKLFFISIIFLIKKIKIYHHD